MASESNTLSQTTETSLVTPSSQSDTNTNNVDLPQQSDPHTQKRSNVNKKRNQNKNKKNKRPYKPLYLDVIQKEIDDLKQAARSTYGKQARLNAEGDLDQVDEQTSLEERQVASTTVDKLEELKQKLSTPEMLQKSGHDYGTYLSGGRVDHTESLRAQHQQETLTLLHFFYIVRLAQQGFLSMIVQNYPNVEPDALIHLCDKLVGSALFVVKDPAEHVRTTKQQQVFDILQKLHDGSSQPIDEGFSTTFGQARHMIYDFIHSSTTSPPTDENDDLQDNTMTSTQTQHPVWLVVPFHGMINTPQYDTSSLASSIKQLAGKATIDSRKKSSQKKSLAKKPSTKTSVENLAAAAPSSSAVLKEKVESDQPPVLLDQIVKSDTEGGKDTETPTLKESGNASGPVVSKEALKETETEKPEPGFDNSEQVADESQKDTHSWHALNAHDLKVDTPTKPSAAVSSLSLPSPSPSRSLPPSNGEDAHSPDVVKSSSTSEKTSEPTVDDNWRRQPLEATTSSERETIGSTTTTASVGDNGDDHGEEEKESSGWGSAPTTISPSWTQGNEDEGGYQQEGTGNNGWGSPIANDTKQPVWEGKLPDDVINPGDETISGDVADTKWQTAGSNDYHQRRTDGGRGRGGSGGFRGAGRGTHGGASTGYRPYGGSTGGSFRGGNVRRGSGAPGSSGWNKPRSPRAE